MRVQPPSLLSIHWHVLAFDHNSCEESKLVLTIRGSTLLGLLAAVYQYAILDKICLLPALIIINSMAFTNALYEFHTFLF